MESTSSLKRSLSDAEDVSSPKRAAAEVEVVVEAAPSVVKVSPLPVRSPLPLRSVPVSVASPKPRKMELPSIPSVSLLKEQVRSSAAELLGKQFDVETSGMVSSGSCGDVFILPLKNRGVDANKTYAVKQQLVLDPSSLNDQAFRECRILLQLNHLRLERKCFNFVHLEKWFKSRPPLLFGAAQDDSSSVYMYFVLDFAQRNLFREQRLEPEQFRLVLFQLLYALSVAQREFQFVHHDLHLKNILLQDQPPGTVMVYRDLGSTWYIPGPLVKIADFGLARLRIRESDPEEVIYNVRDTFSEVFSRDKDLLKLLDEIQKKKPKGSHPELSEGIKVKAKKKGTMFLKPLLGHQEFDSEECYVARDVAHSLLCEFDAASGGIGCGAMFVLLF
jgi:serine/threonine protein kinase